MKKKIGWVTRLLNPCLRMNQVANEASDHPKEVKGVSPEYFSRPVMEFLSHYLCFLDDFQL